MGLKGKFLVVEAVMGKIVESKIVEGEFGEIVKQAAREALGKWNPLEADFIAIRDDRLWRPAGDEDEEFMKMLRERGFIEKTEEGEEIIRIPYYLISYDNEEIDDMNYREKALIVVTAYIGEAYKYEVETDAAELTAGPVTYSGTETN